VSQLPVVSSEEIRAPGPEPGSWVGATLLVSVALQFIGAFLRYETFEPTRRGGLPLGHAISTSFSLYDGLSGGRPGFFLTLGLIAALGCAAALRPNRVRAALIGGFCAPAVGSTAYRILFSTEVPTSVHLGPGYFVVFAGVALEAFVAAWMLVAVVSATGNPAPIRRSGIGLALAAAIVVGASTAINDLTFHYQPLAMFTPLSFKSGAAALVAFVAVAAVPLVAARTGGRVGSAIVVGLAAHEAIRVLDELNQRFGWMGLSLLRVTIGWWVAVVGVTLLLAVAARLAPPKQARQLPVAPGESA
jgi:hypothetical protein